MKKIIVGTLLSCTLAFAGGDVVLTQPEPAAQVEESTWEHKLTIYGWLPDIEGKLKYTIPPEDGGGEGSSSSIDWLEIIDLFFMSTYEARKEKWFFLTDLIYLEMSDDHETSIIGGRVPLATEKELTGWLISTYGGYNTIDTNDFRLDVIGGLRYLTIDLDVTGTIGERPFSTSASDEFYDAVVGLRGHYNINERWYVPYHFDIGGGDVELTWLGELSLGYRFSWGDAILAYRYLYYKNDESGMISELDFYGPKAGVVFHF